MIDSFVYWLSDVFYRSVRDSDYDLIIVESGVTSVFGDTYTPARLAFLQDRGTVDPSDDRPVLAYVNVAVTDHNRTYWEAGGTEDWIIPFDVANGDYGTLGTDAPGWLINNLGFATGPLADGEIEDPNSPGMTIYGPIANYVDGTRNPDGSWPEGTWQDIVIDQAVAMVQAGYSGIFLDDVGRYFEGDANSLQDRAVAMTEFVMDIIAAVDAEAIRLNMPEPLIGINGGAFLVWDNGGASLSQTDFDLMSNVDFLLIENQFNYEVNFIEFAATLWGSYGTQILSVEWADTLLSPGTYQAFAQEYGIVTHVPDDAGYDEFTPLPTAPAPPADYNIIIGDFTSEVIRGTSNDDLIFAMGGDDTVYGFGGNDTIIGGSGDDMLLGGRGNDMIYGEAGRDTIEGNRGFDILFGQGGIDEISGGRGNDFLSGGRRDDLLDGGSGINTVFDDTPSDSNLPPEAINWL